MFKVYVAPISGICLGIEHVPSEYVTDETKFAINVDLPFLRLLFTIQ